VELVEVRNVVRRLEAQLAIEHGADTPAYWCAMADRLHEYIACSRYAATNTQARTPPCATDDPARRAHAWLLRVASAYRALAATSGVNY
jgi:hypothetical protein